MTPIEAELRAIGGQEFTYSLDDIARYYRAYVDLMAHRERVLPGRILRVQHGELVEDLEGSVRTASSEQVRQPLFREGLDQWRHFEPWLGELRSALEGAPAGQRSSSG